MTSLKLLGVGHRYASGPWLFEGLDAEIEDGALVALVGPSGSGKSTLLAIIAGLLQPREGSVTTSPPGRIKAAWVFQSPSGLPRRTPLDQVCGPMLARGIARAEAETEAYRFLDKVGIVDRANDLYRNLSGGEAQRMSLARALAQSASLLLLDEPTGQLDRSTAVGIAEVIEAASRSQGPTIVATHDPVVIERCNALIDLNSIA